MTRGAVRERLEAFKLNDLLAEGGREEMDMRKTEPEISRVK